MSKPLSLLFRGQGVWGRDMSVARGDSLGLRERNFWVILTLDYRRRRMNSCSLLEMQRRGYLFFVLATVAVVFLLGAGVVWPASSLVVATSSGQLRGVHHPWGGAEFLGIPYAQPPVGGLRWREPAPAAAWRGVRNAQAFGAPCAQPALGDWNKHDAEISKEDCLYLNV